MDLLILDDIHNFEVEYTDFYNNKKAGEPFELHQSLNNECTNELSHPSSFDACEGLMKSEEALPPIKEIMTTSVPSEGPSFKILTNEELVEKKRAKNREAARKCKEKKNKHFNKMQSDFKAQQERNCELKEERRLLKLKLDRIKIAFMHYAPHMFQQYNVSQLAQAECNQLSADLTFSQ